MSKDCDAGCVYQRGHPGTCAIDALAALCGMHVNDRKESTSGACDCGSSAEHERAPGCTSPAEAAIFERVMMVEHGMMGGPMKTERIVLGRSSEPPRPDESVAEYHARMQAGIFERGGHIPVVEERTPGSDRAGRLLVPRATPTPAAMRCCGSAAPLHSVGCPVAQVLADMDAGLRPTPTHDGPCTHGVPCTPPAAMLGEAMELLSRAERLCCDAGRLRVAGLIGRVRHDLTGDVDVVEAREGRGDRVESRFCNQDGHRWSGGQCAFCGADRGMEERRGGPAVDKASEDDAQKSQK